jgi:hypothetical protein
MITLLTEGGKERGERERSYEKERGMQEFGGNLEKRVT